MGREKQEVTTETDMSHTSEHDTWRGNITFLSLFLSASHFYNIFLIYIFACELCVFQLHFSMGAYVMFITVLYVRFGFCIYSHACAQ